ncbi:hypothetical protein KI387_027087, partial [Taxus chinensis]
MERMRFWNGLGVTNTTGGPVAIGICERMGVDEGEIDTTGATDTADVMLMVGMGPSYETTRGEAGEGITALLGDDVEEGIR